jgi:hypothetical protein
MQFKDYFEYYLYFLVGLFLIISGIFCNSSSLICIGLFYFFIQILRNITIVNNFILQRKEDTLILKNEYIKNFSIIYYWSLLMQICQIIFVFMFLLFEVKVILLINSFPEFFIIFLFLWLFTFIVDITLRLYILKINFIKLHYGILSLFIILRSIPSIFFILYCFDTIASFQGEALGVIGNTYNRYFIWGSGIGVQNFEDLQKLDSIRSELCHNFNPEFFRDSNYWYDPEKSALYLKSLGRNSYGKLFSKVK